MATPGELRTRLEKEVDAMICDRVLRGIALLKEGYGEDFADHINPKTLNLQDSECCVLGQLYENAEPTPEQEAAFAEYRGFDWDAENADGFDLGLVILDGAAMRAPADFGFDLPFPSNDWDELQLAWEIVLAAERS